MEPQSSAMNVEADKLLAESIRELLRSTVEDHRCRTAYECADALGMSVRHMQRRLRTIDLTFSALLDEVRFDLAKDKLLHSSHTIDEISQALGFSTEQSFIRAFYRWSNISPGEYRRQRNV